MIKNLCHTILNNKALWAGFMAFVAGAAWVKFLDLLAIDVITLVFFFAFYYLIRASFKVQGKRVRAYAAIVAVLFSLFLTLGQFNKVVEGRGFVSAAAFLSLYFVGFWIVLFSACTLFFDWAVKRSFSPAEYSVTKKRLCGAFAISTCIMLVCWLPYYLMDFPANLTPDSNKQLLQAVGLMELSNHHPVAHTMLIKLIFDAGLTLFDGNQTAAIALYAAIQAILQAACYGYLIETMYKFRAPLAVIGIVLAVFSLTPYHAIYSMTVWKDVPFGGIVLVLSATLWRIIVSTGGETKKLPVFETAMFFIFGLLMCVFRSNGFYAYILLILLIFVFFIKKSKTLVLTSVIVFACALIIKIPVYNHLGVIPPDPIESLSIPAQHISRAIVRGVPLTDEEYALLSQVVDVERIESTYLTYISDPIKDLVREKNNQEFLVENKAEFFKLWLNLGLRSPISYIMAQIDQTVGYWYPGTEYWVHARVITVSDAFSMEKLPLLGQGLSSILNKVIVLHNRLPLLGLMWSIGFHTWLCILMVFLLLIKKEYLNLLVYVPVIAVMLTLLIATPVHSEFRYAYSMFTCMPLFLVLPFSSKLTVKTIN